MIPMLALLLCLSSLQRVLAQDDRQPIAGHAFFISHLSPLISYTPSTPTDDPEAGWNVSLARHSTTNANASVEFAFFGIAFDVSSANHSRLEGIDRSYDTGWHEATITMEPSDNSFMDIKSYTAQTNVPATNSQDHLGTAEHISATNTTDFYKDEAGAWEVMEPPVNQSTGVQFSWAWDQPPSYTAEYPFNSTVLSTNQVGKPLRFSVPPYTSILQWYGTVGPDQGRYELRLIPTSEGKIQFQPHSLDQSYTGERSIDAIYETKAIAWLDPRATYDVEIELQEEGKRTDLHGVSFWRYTDVGAEIKDWYSEPSSGLSGGQIAGIVIGSVAGAALIGLAIWWFMRRRNRKQGSAPARKMSDDGQKPLV